MNSPMGRSSDPFVYRVLLASALVIGLLLLLRVLWYASPALLLSFAAILPAIVLRAMTDWLVEHSRLSEPWALTVVIVGLLALVFIVGAMATPQVIEQANQLRQQLPQAINSLHQLLQERAWGEWVLGALPSGEQLQENGFVEVIWRATGLAYTAVQVFFGIFILFFITLYLSINPRLYTNGLLHLVPIPYRPRTAEVLGAAGATLRWWLLGTLVRMVAVGLLSFTGLWLLDIPLAMILALLAAILDFVPYFGPIVAAVPAVLLGFTLGLEQGMYVILVYLVVQQVESLIITPLVYHRTVYLPPVLTILAQIILFAMAGAVGAVLATPLMAVVLVMVKMLYIDQTLGDHQIDRPEDQLTSDGIPPLPGVDAKKPPKGGNGEP